MSEEESSLSLNQRLGGAALWGAFWGVLAWITYPPPHLMNHVVGGIEIAIGAYGVLALLVFPGQLLSKHK